MMFHFNLFTENKRVKMSLIDLKKDLDKIFKRLNVNLDSIRHDEIYNIIEADIYGFVYGFKRLDDKTIGYARNDGKAGSITLENIKFSNNILLPFLEYTTEKGEEKEAIEEKSTDPAIKIHLLLPGDYYISHEKIFCENPVSHRSKGLYLVGP